MKITVYQVDVFNAECNHVIESYKKKKSFNSEQAMEKWRAIEQRKISGRLNTECRLWLSYSQRISKTSPHMVMSTLYWIDHLFFCLGSYYLALLKFDFNQANEFAGWIKLHLSYRSKLAGRVKLPFKRVLKNVSISLFGLLMTAVLILVLLYVL